MMVYRNPMEKILTEQENETVITNPHDRCRTLLRKLAYRLEVWRDRMRRTFRRPSSDDRDHGD